MLKGTTMPNSIFFVVAVALLAALNPHASSAQTLYRQFSGTTTRLNAIAFPTDSVGVTGEHSFAWDAANVPAGTYFCVIQTPAGQQVVSVRHE
jgi:hypothetical protein